eukprot:symbB.v1.2.007367.t1/scaffold451.1/size378644/13
MYSGGGVESTSVTSLKELSSEGLIAALRCAANIHEDPPGDVKVSQTFVDLLCQRLATQAQWLDGWQASHMAHSAAMLGIAPGRSYDILRPTLLRRSTALEPPGPRGASTAAQREPRRTRTRKADRWGTSLQPEAAKPENVAPDGLAEVQRISAALAAFDTHDVEVRDRLASWLLLPIPSWCFVRIASDLAAIGLASRQDDLVMHIRSRARSVEVVSVVGDECSKVLADAYRTIAPAKEAVVMCRRVVPCGRVFPRWASSANPAERRIYDILHKPGSHEVLYHTLQTFAWKIDAKAAINAFCSLARLDTARLVQMAEPGARPARGTGKLDTSLALEAEGGLAKRLDLLLKNREDLPPIHVSNLMWSLAKVAAREPFGSLTEAISKRLVAEVPKLTGRDLATSLWAVAVLVADTPHRQQIDKSLPVFLLQRVGLLAQSKDLKGYDLTQSLWAAAKLANLKVPGMVKLILELVRGALGEATTFECHSISVSLWSIGLTEELHDKEEIQQFAKELAAAGRLLVSSMNSQMLANSAWGAARVQVNDTSFYEALAVAGLDRRKTKDFTVTDQHIYNLAWSFVKAEVYNDATREYLLKAAADGRPGIQTPEVPSKHVNS